MAARSASVTGRGRGSLRDESDSAWERNCDFVVAVAITRVT